MTTVQVELWQLIVGLVGLFIAFMTCVFAFARVLVGQIKSGLDEKFDAQKEARKEADRTLNETLQRHLDEERKTSAKLVDLERDFLTWKAELPEKYVRRDDYIRGQTVIEAKLDALYNKLEVAQLKGAH
ncbi:MAG: hypothetical protein PHY45_11755 [Rhodocyclaceae bacterium]|nr:hypothetical protein [Rhodocyclaceae bacterium]